MPRSPVRKNKPTRSHAIKAEKERKKRDKQTKKEDKAAKKALKEQKKDKVRDIVDRLEGKIQGLLLIFNNFSERLEKLEVKKARKTKIPVAEPDPVPVYTFNETLTQATPVHQIHHHQQSLPSTQEALIRE